MLSLTGNFWGHFPCVPCAMDSMGTLSIAHRTSCPPVHTCQVQPTNQQGGKQHVGIFTSTGGAYGCKAEVSLMDYFLARRVTNEQSGPVCWRSDQSYTGLTGVKPKAGPTFRVHDRSPKQRRQKENLHMGYIQSCQKVGKERKNFPTSF